MSHKYKKSIVSSGQRIDYSLEKIPFSNLLSFSSFETDDLNDPDNPSQYEVCSVSSSFIPLKIAVRFIKSQANNLTEFQRLLY